MADFKVIEDWCARLTGGTACSPLLIRGPVGCGKSVLLESFTLRAAGALLAWLDRPGDSPPVLPLPVRLRALRYDEGEIARFSDFVRRSQDVLDPDDDTGVLSAELLSALRSAGMLLPLFDGFDELPGLTEYGHVRDRTLEAMMAYSRGFCVITSRPWFGAESVVSPANQFDVCPPTLLEVEGFVRGRLLELGGEEFQDAIHAYENTPDSLKRALTRPLFAAAWCQRAEASPASGLTSVSDLMTELYLNCFDDRRRSFPLEPLDQLSLRRPLGTLLTCLLDANGAALGVDAIQQRFDDDSPGSPDALARVLQIALGLDLIRQVGRGAYAAQPSVLADYLVGWRLAELAAGGPRDQQSCIRIFQRLVWLPHLTGSLDQAFRLMAERPASIALGESLIDWLTSSPGARPESEATEVLDDVGQPFGALALRLREARGVETPLSDGSARSIVAGLETATALLYAKRDLESLREANGIGNVLPESIPGATLDSLLHALEAQPHFNPDDEAVSARRSATILLAEYIRPSDAARWTETWALRSASREDGWPWAEAAEKAATRIPESEALTTLLRWRTGLITQLKRDVAHGVIAGAGLRIPISGIPHLAATWLKESPIELERFGIPALHSLFTRLTGDTALAVAKSVLAAMLSVGTSIPLMVWQVLLSQAGERMDPASAADAIHEGCTVLRRRSDGSVRQAWIALMGTAAERIAKEDAASLIETFLVKVHPRSASEGYRLGEIVTRVASRAPGEHGLLLFQRWDARASTPSAGNTQTFWHCAALGAAQGADAIRKAELITLVLDRLSMVMDSEAEPFLDVLSVASTELRHEDATRLLDCIATHRFHPSRQVTISKWRSVKSHLAGCIGPEAAVRFVARLFDEADLDDDSQDMGLSAIRCLSSSAALEILLGRALPAGTGHRLKHATDLLVRRIGGIANAQSCRALIEAGMPAAAVVAASKSANVAIVSHRGPRANSRFTALDRHDKQLVFDPAFLLAPDSIRTIAMGSLRQKGLSDGASMSRLVSAHSDDIASRESSSDTDAGHLRHRERKALAFVADREHRNLDPPTQIEIGTALQVEKDTAHLLCVRLERDLRLIHRPDGGRRGYRLTPAGRSALAALANRSI